MQTTERETPKIIIGMLGGSGQPGREHKMFVELMAGWSLPFVFPFDGNIKELLRRQEKQFLLMNNDNLKQKGGFFAVNKLSEKLFHVKKIKISRMVII